MNFIQRFLESELRFKKLNSPFGYVVFTFLAVFMALLMTKQLLGIVLFAGVIGILFVFISYVSPATGFTLVFLFSSFIFFVQRVINTEVPFGVARDALYLVILIGIAIKKTRRKEPIKWMVKSPVTIALLFYSSYLLIQFFNPESTLSGWLFGMRGFISYLTSYFILTNLFEDFNFVKFFTKLWVGVALLAALYAIYQEYFGLPGYDLRWVTASELRIGLNFIAGRWRKWSFLSDAAAFGLFMSFSSIFCLVLGLSITNRKQKYLLIFSGMLMLVAMAYSGTRTAYAIIPIGLVLYVMLTINRPKTLLFAIVGSLFFVMLIFGPYQNGTIIRVRTAFKPSDDESMKVRDINRANIQPYIYKHPLGGGLVTVGEPGRVYSPHHRLAGFPPDSGYLETALEQGWIGLIIQLGTYFIVLAVGVRNFYASKTPLIRGLLIAHICGFFALTVGVYSKTGVIQMPLGLILMGLYALMYKLKDFDGVPAKGLKNPLENS